MSGSTDIVATRQLPTLPYEIFLMIIKEFIADAKNETRLTMPRYDETEATHGTKDAKDGVKYGSAPESEEEPRPRPYLYVDDFGYDYGDDENGGLDEIQRERYEATRLPLQLNRDTRAMVQSVFPRLPWGIRNKEEQGWTHTLRGVGALLLPERDYFSPCLLEIHSGIRQELCATMLTLSPELFRMVDEICIYARVEFTKEYEEVKWSDRDRKRLLLRQMLREGARVPIVDCSHW
ncbi:hypothetical protein CPLU01_08257 [Colletotrichum plurivorum]|uniref:Uncharacterized protein n=1 Tax=Colletotrichum plurivorum TaxID=2175906 RepID=A0A8H6NDU9_9PEZI|nr:hypothetical protein CPLU01_08257 [Colletotrichum plurivorum]